MKRFVLLPILLLQLGGCVHQTLTEVPSFSGTVVDATTGIALADVDFDEGKTGPDGRFNLPSKAHGVWNFPIPGSGALVEKRLMFRKSGYRDMLCMCRNFALHAEYNQATIPMMPITHSKPANGAPIFLHVTDTVGCQAFVGSRVRYKENIYLISEIYARETEGIVHALFSLIPLSKNASGPIVDVSSNNLQLTIEGGD